MPVLNEPWLKKLSDALNVWCGNNGGVSYLARELEIDSNILGNVLRGANFVGERYPDFYARLYRLTRLSEADPRTLPPTRGGKERKWTTAQLKQWWMQNYPTEAKLIVIQHLLRENGSPQLIQEKQEDNPILENFLQFLRLYYNASPEEREVFYRHNTENLRQIEIAIQTLNQPRSDREASILLIKQFSQEPTGEEI